MLRLLIPVEGALKAARHAAFLFAERCVAGGELVEDLEPPEQGRMSAFRFPGALRLPQKRATPSALNQACAILDDSRVRYHWTRVFGPVTETIAARAAAKQSDVVIVDARQRRCCIGRLRGWERWGSVERVRIRWQR